MGRNNPIVKKALSLAEGMEPDGRAKFLEDVSRLCRFPVTRDTPDFIASATPNHRFYGSIFLEAECHRIREPYSGVFSLFDADLSVTDPDYAPRGDWIVNGPRSLTYVSPETRAPSAGAFTAEDYAMKERIEREFEALRAEAKRLP